MRRFVFPLDRVLRFRRLEMERVEARLSELAFQAQSERRTADERRVQALDSGRELLGQPNLSGADFRVTGHWLKRLEAERNRALETSAKLIAQHYQARGELIDARRKVKLLESLRARKLRAHSQGVAKQLEAQASEFYLAKRIREQRGR